MTLWTTVHQAPLSMALPREEFWSGLPFPAPGDLPDPGVDSGSYAMQADSLPFEAPGKPLIGYLPPRVKFLGHMVTLCLTF